MTIARIGGEHAVDVRSRSESPTRPDRRRRSPPNSPNRRDRASSSRPLTWRPMKPPRTGTFATRNQRGNSLLRTRARRLHVRCCGSILGVGDDNLTRDRPRPPAHRLPPAQRSRSGCSPARRWRRWHRAIAARAPAATPARATISAIAVNSVTDRARSRLAALRS